MIIIFDHTIENKDAIKQAIEQLQSIKLFGITQIWMRLLLKMIKDTNKQTHS